MSHLGASKLIQQINCAFICILPIGAYHSEFGIESFKRDSILPDVEARFQKLATVKGVDVSGRHETISDQSQDRMEPFLKQLRLGP